MIRLEVVVKVGDEEMEPYFKDCENEAEAMNSITEITEVLSKEFEDEPYIQLDFFVGPVEEDEGEGKEYARILSS